MTPEQLEETLRLHRLWYDEDLSGVRANLTGADLRGMDLAHAWLAYADLTDADLTGANLAYADLTCCRLHGTILTEADMTGTIWVGSWTL